MQLPPWRDVAARVAERYYFAGLRLSSEASSLITLGLSDGQGTGFASILRKLVLALIFYCFVEGDEI
jgi:hypothetical protein